MSTGDGGSTIVFNGEIYNFRQLRRELEQLGRHFVGASDTEVLLAAYRTWGEKCVDRLNGMFAFAIYDVGSQTGGPSIFFARDRIGEKPFFYSFAAGHFEFASELKALRSVGRLDVDALNFYLALGYVPAELCLAEGAKKLPAGFAGRLTLDPFQLKTWQYWKLPPFAGARPMGRDELLFRTEELLEDAVRIRLESDVPIGVLLSGGLDSGLVLAMAARCSSKPVQTFTLGLPGSALDESKEASAVARHFGTEHSRLQLERPSPELLDELRPFVDEPIGDSSILPMYAVARLTRRHVTVALGGDGGDEVFGGYAHYRQTLKDESRWGWLPTGLLDCVASAGQRLPAGVKGRNRISSMREGPVRQTIWGTAFFDPGLRERILSREARAEIERLDAPERWRAALFGEGADPVDSMTRMDLKSTLAEGYLVKVDRASMAVSLEMRCPMLDHRLAELYFSRVAASDRVSENQSRILETSLARKLLPQEMRTYRKQGFSVPLDEWFRNAATAFLGDFESRLPPQIDRREVRRLRKGEDRGRANGARLFSLVMLAFAVTNLQLAC